VGEQRLGTAPMGHQPILAALGIGAVAGKLTVGHSVTDIIRLAAGHIGMIKAKCHVR